MFPRERKRRTLRTLSGLSFCCCFSFCNLLDCAVESFLSWLQNAGSFCPKTHPIIGANQYTIICWLGVIPLQPKLIMEASMGFMYIPVREIPAITINGLMTILKQESKSGQFVMSILLNQVSNIIAPPSIRNPMVTATFKSVVHTCCDLFSTCSGINSNIHIICKTIMVAGIAKICRITRNNKLPKGNNPLMNLCTLEVTVGTEFWNICRKSRVMSTAMMT